jgi:hypothetical protein
MHRGSFSDLASDHSFTVGTDIKGENVIHVALRVISLVLGNHFGFVATKDLHSVGLRVEYNTESSNHIDCLALSVIAKVLSAIEGPEAVHILNFVLLIRVFRVAL